MKIAAAQDCAPQVNQCTNPAVMEDEMADREVPTALQNRDTSTALEEMQTRWVTDSSSVHNTFQVRSVKSTCDNIVPWYSVMFAVLCQ